MKIGDLEVNTQPELEAALAKLRATAVERGVPKEQADSIKILSFYCGEHGATGHRAIYSQGCIFVMCEPCHNAIAIIAVADHAYPVVEFAPGTQVN